MYVCISILYVKLKGNIVLKFEIGYNAVAAT